jgi:hypothetical protein
LGNEQTVERVFVVRCQAVQLQHVRQGDGQDEETVSFLLTAEDLGQRNPEVELPQLTLDLNFPDARDTQENHIGAIQTMFSDNRRQPVGFAVPPDEGVRVKKQFHASFTQKSSGNASSKSALT